MLFALTFQFKLFHLLQRRIDRVEQARRLEVVEPRQVPPALQSEMLEKAHGRRISERPPGHFAPPRGPHPARLHQHVQRALGDLHPADRLDLGAADRLVIGDDRQRLGRAEIEAIRGVQISKGTLDVLMDAGWVKPAGRREGPGRPLLYATTDDFLTHFGLASRRDLPGIDDLKAAGLLDPLDEALEESLGELQLESESEED
jgi:hypothetical protein